MSSSLQVIAGLSGLFAACAVLYRLIRPKFPIKVTCWFCSCSTTVPFFNLNCWNCPDCDQYNGFTADGDYNKPIPAQYDEGLNHIFTASQCSGHRPRSRVQSYNGLCSDCNRNQHLKVRQLALFEPINDKNYDDEVENYRRHLESLYRLCAPCKSLVDYELNRQNHILTKLVEKEEFEPTKSEYSSHQNSPPFIVKRTHFIVHILWFWTVITSFVTASANLHMAVKEWLKPLMKFNYADVIGEDLLETVFNWTHFEGLVGLFVFLIATFIHGSNRLRGIDAICSVIRLPLIALHFVKHWTFYEDWILIAQLFLSCLCCLITCFSVLSHYSSFKFLNYKKSNKSDYVEPHEVLKIPGLSKQKNAERNTIHYEDQDFAEEEDDLDLGGNLNAMSLGPHSPKTKTNLSANASFLTSASSSHSVNSSSSGSSFCRKRPLLSPSRFNLSTMSSNVCRASSSLSCSCTTSYNNNRKHHTNSLIESEHSDYINDNDSNISETSTNCLVDTTTGPVPDSTSTKHIQPKKKKLWLIWLLGMSIGVNISLFLYVLHTTKIWTGLY